MWSKSLKATGGIFKDVVDVGGSGINGMKKIGSGIGGVAEGGLKGGLGAIKGIGTLAGRGIGAVADN